MAPVPEPDTAIARCRREIASIEALLRAGHPDIADLCMALSDWSAELRLLQKGRGLHEPE